MANQWNMEDSLVTLDHVDADIEASSELEKGKGLLVELEQKMSLLRLNSKQMTAINEVLNVDVDDELTLDQPLMEMNDMIILPTSPIPGRLSGWINENHESYIPMNQSNSHEYDNNNVNLDANISQLLSDIRNTITSNINNGKGSLSDYYNIFDRDKNMFFNAEDFMNGCAVLLKASIPLYLATFAISSMAVDGENTVSYGEFKIFILYWEVNKSVEHKVVDIICKSIEKQGLAYVNFIKSLFVSNEKLDHDSGFCSLEAFSSTMKILGIMSDDDINKLVMRFDIHGTKSCSVTRFLAMLERSARYKQAIREVTVINQAISESQQVKQMLVEQRPLPVPLQNISAPLIDMCVYLGIRVMTDMDIIWIAEDALRAPLPGLEWTIKHDNAGRIFFHNTLTNESKWDHPLDYHFRKLRDSHRKYDSNDDKNNAAIIDYTNINEQFLQGYKTSINNNNTSNRNETKKVNYKLPKIINKLKDKIADEQYDTPRLHFHETHELKPGREPLRIKHYEGDEINMCYAYTKGTISDPNLRLDQHELEKKPVQIQTKLKKKITDKIYRRTEFGILNVFRKAKYGQLKFLPANKKKAVMHKDDVAVVTKLLQVEEPPGYMGQKDDVRSYRPSADELLTPKEVYMKKVTRLMYDDNIVQLLGNRGKN